MLSSDESCQVFNDLGSEWELSDELFHGLDKCVYLLYSQPTCTNVNMDRYNLFQMRYSYESSLLSNSDSLRHHSTRACYQDAIHQRSLNQIMSAPNSINYGWQLEKGELSYVWMKQPPALPNVLTEGKKHSKRSKKVRKNKKASIAAAAAATAPGIQTTTEAQTGFFLVAQNGFMPSNMTNMCESEGGVLVTPENMEELMKVVSLGMESMDMTIIMTGYTYDGSNLIDRDGNVADIDLDGVNMSFMDDGEYIGMILDDDGVLTEGNVNLVILNLNVANTAPTTRTNAPGIQTTTETQARYFRVEVGQDGFMPSNMANMCESNGGELVTPENMEELKKVGLTEGSINLVILNMNEAHTAENAPETQTTTGAQAGYFRVEVGQDGFMPSNMTNMCESNGGELVTPENMEELKKVVSVGIVDVGYVYLMTGYGYDGYNLVDRDGNVPDLDLEGLDWSGMNNGEYVGLTEGNINLVILNMNAANPAENPAVNTAEDMAESSVVNTAEDMAENTAANTPEIQTTTEVQSKYFLVDQDGYEVADAPNMCESMGGSLVAPANMEELEEVSKYGIPDPNKKINMVTGYTWDGMSLMDDSGMSLEISLMGLDVSGLEAYTGIIGIMYYDQEIERINTVTSDILPRIVNVICRRY
ncbi:hypothetical protein GQR58_027315 [Nymphon striatum]|nr:hypothetical protein GQR58_027315 [Nymphon striatum]